MQGWKTVLFGAVVAIGPAALDYIGAINWQTLGVSPGAGAIIGAIIVGLRAITSTPVGSK